MKLENVENLLSKLDIPIRPREMSGIWANFQCPFAPWYHKSAIDKHPSFGISVTEEGRSHYTCFSCQQKGSLALLPAKIGRLRGIDYSELIKWAERAEFEDTGPATIPEWDENGKIVNVSKKPKEVAHKLPKFGSAIGHWYLEKRGYDWRDAFRLRLRFDEAQQRILFPVYNNQLQLEGYTGRSVMPNHLITKGKGTNPKTRDYGGLQKERLFLFNKNIGTAPIVLVEGAFDYARVYQAGFCGAMAVLGTALTDYKVDIIVAMNRPVFLFLDNDTAGDAATFGVVNRETGLRESTHRAWAERLYQHVPVWLCQYPESAEMEGRGDPDSLTIYEVRSAIKNAKLYRGLFSLPEYSRGSDIPF